ncbi:CPBP family intramembrane metalloprotease [Geitlerinema sp. P-1104]|uniref:CPBP family intramembrane glutamic endopeptidase n=1 Tax=Geitlerinema sp. P-1104 TaxID=2546230 RepID=UPI001476F312|nr:type II CAAX endopeptidase family protein [Geitlerinema sp. P-1104]NMG58948.1 CPBP family intramembrane metalloprotease [Geitlerinema sp. P-1104]
MSPRQLILLILSALTTVMVALALVSSWQQPQIQSRLDLAQTNLSLQAAEWEPPPEWDMNGLPGGIIGEDVYETAIAQYRDALNSVRRTLDDNQQQQLLLSDSPVNGLPELNQLDGTIRQAQDLKSTLELRLGILLAQGDRPEEAFSLWRNLLETSDSITDNTQARTATILIDLWNQSPPEPDNAEALLNNTFSGWFRDRALSQLYRVQQEDDALAALQAQEQETAQQTLIRLVILTLISGVTLLLGTLLLLFLLGQWFFKGETAILAKNQSNIWELDWGWETIAQVIVVGFFLVFFIGQALSAGIIFPLFYKLVNLDADLSTTRWQAISIFLSYLLSAAAALGVLYRSLTPYFPLRENWFRFRLLPGLGWGFGGYIAAVPLVLGISLINQEIWDGKGGSNPILEIVLEGQDWVAIICLFLTASVLAPIFEELIFRGFLLPSLTRYIPVWGAILLSSLIFAVAHLSVSEVLPLATLGIVLGITYTRSRNLLAAMLMHGLWNSGTLISLIILGGGAT